MYNKSASMFSLIRGFSSCGSRRNLSASYVALHLTRLTCITQWLGEFCPLYAELRRLQWILPGVVFYAAAAMLPPHSLRHVKDTLPVQPDKTRVIWLSNDRPNIHLQVLAMLELVHSDYDILCVLRFAGDPAPPLFMVFCNDRKETEQLCQFACSQAPSSCWETARVPLWYESTIPDRNYRETLLTQDLGELLH
jgi:hypothetical protein